METAFILTAIMLVYLDLMLAIELGRRRQGEQLSRGSEVGRVLLLMPVAWIVATVWPLLGSRPFGRERLPPAGDVLLVIGTLALPQFAAAVQRLPYLSSHVGFLHDKGYNAVAEHQLRNLTVLVLMLASIYAGLFWRSRVWLICATCFYVPFVLLFTTFFTNPEGFWTGIWGSLDYWLAQQDVRRGNQPTYYYAMLTPLYEFLPLLLALGGAAWIALRGDAFKRWLLFWLAGIFLALTLAGEKMPWLEVHIALPLTLVAAVALAAAWERLDLSAAKRWPWLAVAGLVSVAATLLLVESESLRPLGIALAAVLAALLALSLWREGLAGLGRLVLTGVCVALLALTVRAALNLSFQNPDTPVEMLVYTQTSPDVPRIRDQIEQIARESGLGHNLPIVVDPTDGYTWPWAWYLRDYQVSYYLPQPGSFQPPQDAVLLIAQSNASSIDGTAYTAEPFKLRWWFCETYRDPSGDCLVSGELTPSQIIDKLTSPSQLRSLGHFFLYRRPVAGTTGSSNATVFFPAQYYAGLAAASSPAPPAPQTLLDGQVVFGAPGSSPGHLRQPADVYVDAQGAIWVADAKNNRIDKFDAAGNFLASAGQAGNGPGRFTEPWGVAVDGQGNVYVADTWNHRIVQLGPDLKFVRTWGQPAVQTNPGPLLLFGPRDIVLAADGSLWVSDTGNKRLIHYSPEGQPLGVHGREGSGDGQFQEPVGLALAPDGSLLVADTWNGRVQRLSPDLTSATSFAAGWTSRDILAKPYLALLSDGRIVASDPGQGILLLFSANGQILGSWQPAAGSQPIGVAALPDGGFVFSDAALGQGRIVPGHLVDSLFR
jgi:DNA-binding beta-propeller fold protein YncE